jgi:hypothetical protein
VGGRGGPHPSFADGNARDHTIAQRHCTTGVVVGCPSAASAKEVRAERYRQPATPVLFPNHRRGHWLTSVVATAPATRATRATDPVTGDVGLVAQHSRD